MMSAYPDPRLKLAGADRVGLGWRGELAASILDRLAQIEVVEVIAEDWIHAGRRESAALADLAASCPLLLHGVSLGLASSEPVAASRLERLARLIDRVRPQGWSEHLAFVRAGGVEIGHLAAPPRTAATIDGALANLERARRTVGALPCVENIATLIDPPASCLAEGEWVRAIAQASGAGMLLDLHNLYANALNFGVAPEALLRSMPLERVEMVHLSGGRWIGGPGGGRRLLDDHLHDVPDAVYSLLETVARAAPRALTVIVERDGNYPAFSALLGQVERARTVLARGRAQRIALEKEAA
jgi:uncharacterized protein (UPF0276 family)